MNRLVTVDFEALRREVEEALRGFPEVAAVYLFGSALGECRPDSDLDLAVILPPESVREPRAREHWETRLAERLTRFQGHPVDLVVFDPRETLFAFAILSQGRPLLLRDADLVGELREKVSVHYAEVYPLYQQAVREVLQGAGIEVSHHDAG